MSAMGETAKARSLLKLDAAPGPLAELSEQVFGDQSDQVRMAYEFRLLRSGLGADEYEIGGAVRRRDDDPWAARLDSGVEVELEAEAVEVKVEAEVEVAHEDGDGLEAKVGRLAIKADRRIVEPFARRVAHRGAL